MIAELSYMKNKTATLESACKIVCQGLKALEVGANFSSPGMKQLTDQMGAFTDLTGALNIVDRAHDWFSNEQWTWKKYIEKSALTVCHSLDTVSFLHKAGAIDLGNFTRWMAPGFVPLELTKNLFYIPASICGIWSSIEEIANIGLTAKAWFHTAQLIGKLVLNIFGLIATMAGIAATQAFVAIYAVGWFITHQLNLFKGMCED